MAGQPAYRAAGADPVRRSKMNSRRLQISRLVAPALFCIKLLVDPSEVSAVEPNSAIRLLPYPYAHVVSFASDVDAQRPWHGAAIHRIFNEDLGLTISD